MIHPLIKTRRSPVLFSDRSITREDLKDIFEAARRAPSSRNQQSWRKFSGMVSGMPDFNMRNALW